MRLEPSQPIGLARRLAGAPVAVGLAACALLVPPPEVWAQADEVPDPATGTWASTTVALLDYNRELCDGIAGKVVDYWRGLSASPAAQLESVRRYVVNRELSNLAAGRAASDIAEGFLPRVSEEAGSATAASLERLHEMQVELCDKVAYPNTTREKFEAELSTLLDRIEREGSELGRLLVVSEEVLDSAVSPYLRHIQMAGVEAEGEYSDYLESLKPPPVLPTRQELMEVWHRSYAQAVHPTKQALGKYLRSRRQSDSRLIRTACRELSAAVIPLMRKDDVFKAPERGIFKPLRSAFLEIKQLAVHCSAGRSREMKSHYDEMQKQLAAASQVLAEYSLKP